MVKLKNYSAFIWLNGVVKSVSPPTAIWKMINDWFFVTKNLTVPLHNLSAHCKLTVAHSTNCADFLKEEHPRSIFCSVQCALTSSQSVYHMLRNTVIVHELYMHV
jgi:hypothetical protein